MAIKILNKKKLKAQNMISKLKKEIRIMKMLDHPNIIKLFEVLDIGSEILVVIEYASGGELFDFIQQRERVSSSS